MRRPAHFPGCKPLIMSQPTMLVSVNHIMTEDNTKNKFATLSTEVPAPHSDQLQQQFQQLQAQMRQLEQQLHGRESTTHTGGRPLHRSPGRPSHASERYTLAGGRFVYQSRDRSSHEAESSRQGSARYHNSSYPPQYDRRILSPHRGSTPWLYNDTRRPLVQSQFNSQANQEWRRVSPNRERRNTGGSHQEQAVTPTSTRTRQEWQGPPPQQIMQHPTIPAPQVVPSSNAQHNPSLLPTPTVPSTTPYTLSANRCKRENHRSNQRALYQELQELVLSKVHVRVWPKGQVHPFYDKIMLRLDPTLKENERYRYLVERLVPRPRSLQGNTQTTISKGEASSPKQEKPIVEVAIQNKMKTSSHAPTSLKEVEQIKAQTAIPCQGNE
jgi:hypothetical protein